MAGARHMPLPAALCDAADRRVATFVAGRHCAEVALGLAGCDARGIGIALDGAPLWPTGFVGSISHTDSHAMAVVARATDLRSIGVDCEHLVASIDADAIGHATVPELCEPLVRFAVPLTWPEIVTIGFSAKESLYKCLRPVVGRYFDFSDARIESVDGSTGRVALRLTRTLAPTLREGDAFIARFVRVDDRVITIVALPHAT